MVEGEVFDHEEELGASQTGGHEDVVDGVDVGGGGVESSRWEAVRHHCGGFDGPMCLGRLQVVVLRMGRQWSVGSELRLISRVTSCALQESLPNIVDQTTRVMR